MPRGVFAGISCLFSAIALAACGGSDESRDRDTPDSAVRDDQRAVLATVDDLRAASRRGDAQAICEEVFTRSLARSITKTAGRGCVEEVRERYVSSDAEISVGRSIKVTGDRATAVIREAEGGQSTLHLRREDGRWRIDSVEPARAG